MTREELNGEIMELETAEKRIEELEKDLALNAKMLARQCDMAREAEFQASILQERVEKLQAAIAAIKDIIAEVLECETINIRRRG
jgi:prefoldin subunit 5